MGTGPRRLRNDALLGCVEEPTVCAGVYASAGAAAVVDGAGGALGAGVRPVRLLLILTDGRVDTYQVWGEAGVPRCGPVSQHHVREVCARGCVARTSMQAREARLNACRLADELWGCTLAAFGVGRGVDRSELLHIIDTPQGVVPCSSSSGERPVERGPRGLRLLAARHSSFASVGVVGAVACAGDAASRYLDLYTRDDAPW